MASIRDLQSKAKKLLVTWRKYDNTVLAKDERSVCSHLCMTILMRNNSVRNANQAEKALRERFSDWNEIRVSPIAEVVEVLEKHDVPEAEAKAYGLRRFLRDLFSKYTKTNLNFDRMEIPEVAPPPPPKDESGKAPAPVAAAEEAEDDEDEPVSRESGLPPDPKTPGFVDMERVLNDPVPLDPKLVTEKNGAHIAMIAWDEAERGPFSAVWRVGLAEGLVEPDLPVAEALLRLRAVAPEKELAAFAYYAIIHAEQEWAEVTKEASRLREKYAAEDAKETAEKEEEERISKSTGKQKVGSGKK
ncbi:MAG: hypothetical protein IT462_00435 [Planctomycetes bacterium]|nr:hypothetical protein [Planctomycetota bacterium]